MLLFLLPDADRYSKDASTQRQDVSARRRGHSTSGHTAGKRGLSSTVYSNLLNATRNTETRAVTALTPKTTYNGPDADPLCGRSILHYIIDLSLDFHHRLLQVQVEIPTR